MWDVACLGELFIDLVPHSLVNGQWTYLPSPGGAPGNVAAGLAKLGCKSLMLSRVGDEAFGRLLVSALERYGVDTSGIVLSASEKTGLSVVALSENGDRSFMFYHDRPADLNIDPDDIDADILKQSKILHVGVLPLSAPKSAVAQRKAMDIADAAEVLISSDVNFRPNLWSDPEAMLIAGREVIARSAFVKVSEEELALLSPSTDMDRAVRALWHDSLQIFSVTRGAEGAVLYDAGQKHICGGFVVAAIDTTGAGDAYTATVLARALAGDDARLILRRACAAGAIAATRKGAMESLPSRREIETLLSL